MSRDGGRRSEEGRHRQRGNAIGKGSQKVPLQVAENSLCLGWEGTIDRERVSDVDGRISCGSIGSRDPTWGQRMIV